MKLRSLILCCSLVVLLTACSKSSAFPTGSQDVNIAQEQKNVTITVKSISYGSGSPTPNHHSMYVTLDISNQSTESFVIRGSIDPEKGKDLTVITIGNEQYIPYSWTGKIPGPDVKDREFTVPGGFLTAIWSFGVMLDTLSPPNFKNPIKCKIRGTLGDEKIEFVLDLPSPPN